MTITRKDVEEAKEALEVMLKVEGSGWDIFKARVDALQTALTLLKSVLEDGIGLGEEEIEKILKTTQIGTYHSIAIKGQPKPEPEPLHIHDYKIDLGGVMKLAHALHSAQRKGIEG